MANATKLREMFSNVPVSIADGICYSPEMRNEIDKLNTSDDAYAKCSTCITVVHSLYGVDIDVFNSRESIGASSEYIVYLDSCLLDSILENVNECNIDRVELMCWDVDGDVSWYVNMDETIK